MDRLPETQTLSTLSIAMMVIALCGCRTQSTSMANPFMAPDRVPPPSTRPMIAPGTAQPYYPGDPMPAAQAAPPAPPVTPVAAAAPMAVPAGPPPAASPPTPEPTAPQPLAFSNERSVSIPTDDQSLRFALPQPEPPPAQTPMPFAATAAAAPAIAATQPQPAAAPVQATNPQYPVSPAVFNNAPSNDITPLGADEPTASGMWRAPQLPANGSMPQAAQASYTVPVQGAQPVAAPQIAPPQPPPPIANPDPMPVQLRATTPPPTQPMMQPVYNSPPRMRFPNFFGWGESQPQPMAAPPQPAPQVAMPATSDGFRPRSSAR